MLLLVPCRAARMTPSEQTRLIEELLRGAASVGNQNQYFWKVTSDVGPGLPSGS